MKKLASFLPALFFYALIFVVSSRNLGFTLRGGWLDKIPHALVYAAMGFLLSLGFFRAVPSSPLLTVALVFLSGTLLGVLDEFHQKFVGGRVSDPRDAAADAIGVAIGIAVYWFWQRKKTKRPAA
jgi:VanZ family protein